MPPKAKYTREDVIDIALNLVREKGFEALTARDLGERLNTSTRPIFTAFDSMEDVKKEVLKAGEGAFFAYVADYKSYFPAFKKLGLLLVEFAAKEPKIFEMLFLQKNEDASSTLNILHQQCVEAIGQDNKMIPEEKASEIFTQVWTFTFGLAVFISRGVYAYKEEMVSDMISRAFAGALAVVQAGEKSVFKHLPKKQEDAQNSPV